jgi:glycosyltransferase involved in cell wall biosynthesis
MGSTPIFMTSVLIDSSGLHLGGGVQVAVSFLDELAALITELNPLATWPTVLRVEASSVVGAELAPATAKVLDIAIVDRRPTQLRRWLMRGRRFNVSFVIFGPEYGRRRADRRVVGFADVTSIFKQPTDQHIRLPSKARERLRALLSIYLHSRADLLLVETSSTADALKSTRAGRRNVAIALVPNALNGILTDPSRWEEVKLPTLAADSFTLSYVARGYPHKNHRVLSHIASAAAERHSLPLMFLVTLNQDEWSRLAPSERLGLINIGPIRVAQVPSLLQQCDGAIFPSLLESFSATPLEAMAMGKLLFASERSFVRSVCAEAPVYIDPTSPVRAADTIAHTVANPILVQEHISRGLNLVRALPTARHRALAYLELLRQQASSPQYPQLERPER